MFTLSKRRLIVAAGILLLSSIDTTNARAGSNMMVLGERQGPEMAFVCRSYSSIRRLADVRRRIPFNIGDHVPAELVLENTEELLTVGREVGDCAGGAVTFVPLSEIDTGYAVIEGKEVDYVADPKGDLSPEYCEEVIGYRERCYATVVTATFFPANFTDLDTGKSHFGFLGVALPLFDPGLGRYYGNIETNK